MGAKHAGRNLGSQQSAGFILVSLSHHAAASERQLQSAGRALVSLRVTLSGRVEAANQASVSDNLRYNKKANLQLTM